MAQTPHTPKNHQNHGIHSAEHESVLTGAAAGGVETHAQTQVAPATISLIKGCERWNFQWEPGDEATLINRIAEMARDPSVPFDWYDAAVVCKHIAQPFASSKS